MATTKTIHAADAVHRLTDEPSGKLSSGAAKAIMELRFDERDIRKMRRLAAKNRDGTITGDELKELDKYVNLGLLVDLLHAKARKALKRTSRSG